MLLRRFDDHNLAQVSHPIGCQATSETVVVDPERDVRQYIEAAEAEEVRVTHATETRIHADDVSNAGDWAASGEPVTR